MAEETEIAQRLREEIDSDARLGDILTESGSTLREAAPTVTRVTAENWDFTMTLSTRVDTPIPQTLRRLETRVRDIVADVAGAHANVTVHIHVNCVG